MNEPGLKRVIGLPAGILLVAGTMIGSGAFKKIVPMAQLLHSEPYIIASWVIAGTVTLFGAFTYAGLTKLTTETGGVYEYLRLIYGNVTSYLFGWTIFTIVGSGAIAALSFVFAQSVNTLISLPGVWGLSGVKLLAVAMILLLTWINCRGIKNGSLLNNIITSAKIIGILMLIVAALFYHHQTVNPPVNDIKLPPPHGLQLLSALFGAMLSALWAYDGWANITFITGELKNPQRNLPYAITGGVVIAITLYVLLNYGYMAVMPLSKLASLGPDRIAAAEVAGIMLGQSGRVMIAVLIMACTFSALNACIISYPRVYFRMAQEKMFFKSVAHVHSHYNTPYVALWLSAVWSIVLVFSGTFDLITDMVIFASYAFFGLAAFGLIKMKISGRITDKVIGYPVIPWLIVIFCVILVINTFITQPGASLAGALLICSGLPLYIFFRRNITSA